MSVPEKAPPEAAEHLYYPLPSEQVLSSFDTGPTGLSAPQDRERLEKFGPNELSPLQKSSPWTIFSRQFYNLLSPIPFTY